MSKDSRFSRWVRRQVLLFRSIPAVVVALFTISVIAMNILANKTLVNLPWIAIDGGILISWLSFLTMDIVTKHFGPKAATKMSVFAAAVNLVVCLIFFIASIIPTQDDFGAFNSVVGGTWFILLSSTIAFICSAAINNFTNYWVGKAIKKNPDGRLAFFLRSLVSTLFGQFLDNLIFAVLCFMVFAPIFWDGFSWTFVQCVTCSALGALLELALELIFTPIGYRVCRKWKEDGVGDAYFRMVEGENSKTKEEPAK